MALIIFHLQDAKGAPLAGVRASSTGGPGPWESSTNVCGDVIDPATKAAGVNLDPGTYEVTFSKPGYTTRVLPAALRDCGIINVALQGGGAGQLPHLEIRGLNFVDTNGERISLNGLDQFRAFRQYLDGENLAPLFEESAALGVNMWRVFSMGSIAQNGLLGLHPQNEPEYFARVRPFADLLNAHGIVVLWTVFVDAQDVMPSAADRAAHWQNCAAALRGSATLLSGGNEWQKNGFDPGELTDPGMLWSRGSALGDVAPYKPVASFAEFHPRRDLPAALMDTVASPVYIRGEYGVHVPLIMDEPPRMGPDGSGAEYAEPFTCYAFARHYATECGGAVFHSRPGQRGVVMDPETRACAESWQRGMNLG